MRIVSVYMRIASALFLAGIALACSEKKYEMFSLEEANKAEYFGKAYEFIWELYAASRDDDSITGRKRSAALAWVLIDFSYNHATGSCAKWVVYAQMLGLLEAHKIMADPPEKLRGYMLSPEEQRN